MMHRPFCFARQGSPGLRVQIEGRPWRPAESAQLQKNVYVYTFIVVTIRVYVYTHLVTDEVTTFPAGLLDQLWNYLMFPLYTTRWDVGAERKRRLTPDELKLIEEREAYAKRCAGLAEQYAGTARGAEYAAEASKWRMAARDARNGKFYPVK